MTEEKVNVNLENFSKTEGLIISPIISDMNQRTLIGIYLQELFSKDNDSTTYNFINAENSLLLATLELCTNLKLVSDDGKPLFNLNDVFYNIKEVKSMFSKIRNHDDFIERLYATVEMVKEERRLEKSLGSAIDGLYSKLLGLIDAFGDIDPEKISAMIAELEKSPILKESVEIFKNQKTPKTTKKKNEKSAE